jgi:hypothetical protein
MALLDSELPAFSNTGIKISSLIPSRGKMHLPSLLGEWKTLAMRFCYGRLSFSIRKAVARRLE